jgi:hypothetical protein
MLNKNNEKNSFAICYGFCKFELSLTGLKVARAKLALQQCNQQYHDRYLKNPPNLTERRKNNTRT